MCVGIFIEFLDSFLSLCACFTIHYFSLSQDRTKTHTYNDKSFDMQKYDRLSPSYLDEQQ